MLKEGTGFSRVIICCGRVDLRKGIPGLSAYVRLNYGLDAAEKGTLFLFCGNRTNCIKGLLFEGDGMLLLTKKLFAIGIKNVSVHAYESTKKSLKANLIVKAIIFVNTISTYNVHE